MAAIADDDRDELLLSCRYGDIEDIRQFVHTFGPAHLSTIRDQNGNTILHMICGNGHVDVLEYVLPLVTPALLATQNHAKSTPLHWAALNSQLAIAQQLVEFPGGPGIDLIEIKNAAGRSPLGEAELAGWEEGAKWLVQMMRLDCNVKPSDDVDDDEAGVGGRIIDLEVEDANGETAKVAISEVEHN